jgi:hypothetical protein
MIYVERAIYPTNLKSFVIKSQLQELTFNYNNLTSQVEIHLNEFLLVTKKLYDLEYPVQLEVYMGRMELVCQNKNPNHI